MTILMINQWKEIRVECNESIEINTIDEFSLVFPSLCNYTGFWIIPL